VSYQERSFRGDHEPAADLRLEVRQVSKLFGTTVALWQVSLEVRAGQFILALGANGSGKSTLLRVIAGFSVATAGEVRWTRGTQSGPPRIAYLGHASGLYDGLTPLENLGLAARLTRVDPMGALKLLDRIGAKSVAGVLCGRLSAGMRRRIGLARVFASNADAILLDEPLAALDEAGAAAVLELIGEATQSGRLVVAAAPSDARLRDHADHTLALVDGRILRALPSGPVRFERADAG